MIKKRQIVLIFGIVFTVLILLCGITLTRIYPFLKSTPEVNAEQAEELRRQGAFILDVREPEEWSAGHIPASTLIPLDELAERMDEIPRDAVIVVVCRMGVGSAQAGKMLLNAGYEQVNSLQGGMAAWQAGEYMIEKSE